MITLSEQLSNIKASIVSYKFETDVIRMKIKVNTGEPLEYKNGRYAVLLKRRNEEGYLRLDVVSIDLADGEFNIWVNLNVRKCIELIENGTADFYLIDTSSDCQVRVKAKKMNDYFEKYYSVSERVFVSLYETKKGNLSISKTSGGAKFQISEAMISDDGKLSVQGVLNCTKLHSDGLVCEVKEIRVKDAESNVLLKTNVDSCFNIAENAKKIDYTGIDCSKSGFYFELDMVEVGIDGGEVKGSIYLVLADGEDEIEVELTQPLNKVSVDKVIKINEKISWLVSIKGKKVIKFAVEDVRNDLEVREVYVRNASIEFVFADKKELNIGEKKDIEIILKDRVSRNTYDIRCTVRDEEPLKIIGHLDELGSRKKVDLDIYDVFLRVDGIDRKISSREDDILDKKKAIAFPRIHFIDREGNALSVEPYYTLTNSIAFNVKKMMEIKSISSVESSAEGISLKGKIYIRKPLAEGESQIAGVLKLDMGYGVNVRLKYVAALELGKNATVQYDFDMLIPKSSMEKEGYSIKQILKGLSDNVVYCSVDSMLEKRTFVMNVKAEHLKVTIEDKLKKVKLLKDILDGKSEDFYKLCNKVLPMNNKMVVFQSYYGKSYSCNPKAIYEELIKVDKGYKCVWVLNDTNKEIPGGPKIVKPKSISYYYYMARAKYFVNNANFPDFYNKRKNAINIETWHGTPLKKLGLDVDESSKAYKENTSKELLSRVKRWDSLVVPNEYTGEILSRAYDYGNEVLTVGYPRNDVFYKGSDEQAAEIRKKLNIPSDKKIIMYAPTWRENEKRTGSYRLPFDADEFISRFGDEYVLLLRLHYFDANRVDNSNYGSSIKNVSFYDDIAELYLVSDVLITDYSSVMFDYANSKKPLLFYAYDIDVYEKDLRGLYFDFRELAPGPVIEDEEGLFKAILDIDKVQQSYKRKYEAFHEKFCSLEDGSASEKVVERLFRK